MAQILKLDTFDLSPYVRLQPDEKFDPAQNPVEPRFSEAAAGEGQPLIAFDQPNKVLSWPVHLTPFKSVSYADTEDGLHDLVIDINGACARAKRVEWRMDGATFSTYWDVVAAVFKPDFSYFKTRQFWLSGVLTVYVRPYGDTGTARWAGTAAGTGVAVAANLGALEGDAPAQVRAIITTGSQPVGDGRIAGVALIPSSYVWDVPLASMAFTAASAALVGGSGAPGSQYLNMTNEVGTYMLPNVGVRADEDGFFEYGKINLSPASVYLGVNRVLAVARHSRVGGVQLRLAKDPERPAVYVRAAPSAFLSWGAVDLGAFSIPTNYPLATVTLALRRRNSPYAGPFYPPLQNSLAQGGDRLHLARVLVLPEDSMTVTVDADRTLIGGIGALMTQATTPVTQRVDISGNTLQIAPALSTTSFVEQGIGADGMGFPVSAGARSAGNLVNATAADMKVRVAFSYLGDVPSMAAYAGKHIPSQVLVKDSFVGARLHHASSGWSVLNILQQVSVGGVASTFVYASLALASGLVSRHVLEVTQQGPQVTARVYPAGITGGDLPSTSPLPFKLAALVSNAAAPDPLQLGNPAWALTTPSGGFAGVYGADYSAIPSRALAPRDEYVFDGLTDRTWLMTTASAFVRERDSVTRGRTPRAVPSQHAQTVGFVLPLDNTVGNDLIALEVQVRERFQYAR